MGFERVVAVLQCTDNYGIDLFTPLMDRIGDLVGQRYAAAVAEQQVAFRVVADHVRMLSFSIADGALPSNEGRGYVLRRLLRRAARYGRLLDMAEPFVHRLVPTVAEIYAAQFPEVAARADYIGEVIKAEEASFGRTLGRGLEIFSGIVQQTTAGGASAVPGGEAFRLYDTYGFPLDLTRVLAEERGLGVDEAGFDAAMQEQRERARRAGKFAAGGVEASEWVAVSCAAGKPTVDGNVEAVTAQAQRFVGYERLQVTTRILQWASKDDRYHVVLAETPFYAEAGGQVGDRGTITVAGLTLTVADTQRDGDLSICRCRALADGLLLEPDWAQGPVTARVDAERRGPHHGQPHRHPSAAHGVAPRPRRPRAPSGLAGGARPLAFRLHPLAAGGAGAARRDRAHRHRRGVRRSRRGLLHHRLRRRAAAGGDGPVRREVRRRGARGARGRRRAAGEPGTVRRLPRAAHRPDRAFVITSEGSIASGVRRIEARTGGAALAVVQEQRAALQQVSALCRRRSRRGGAARRGTGAARPPTGETGQGAGGGAERSAGQAARCRGRGGRRACG